jgi:hypothetical protein
MQFKAKCRLAARIARIGFVALLTQGALVGLTACQDSGVRPGQAGERPKPIAECSEYEALLNSCFHRTTSFTSQPSIMALAKADPDRARDLCADNLKKIRAACR